MKNILRMLSVLLLIYACKEKEKRIQFYHWKSDAILSSVEKEALVAINAKKTYIHYFDVVASEGNNRPVGVVQAIDPLFKNQDVIPVVFISNKVFKNKDQNISELVNQIAALVQQIHHIYFENDAEEIQIDCDWTKSTKAAYFQFLKLLKKKVTLSTTIRLHQIKYQKETGVPPADYGVLMLYNVGELNNFKENSILNSTIVSQYIKKTSTYPLLLDVALPFFSQVVIKNKENDIRLINNVVVEDFSKDTIHFQSIGTNQFKVIKKKLYKGHYLYKDYVLKLEKTSVAEILSSNALVQRSNLNLRNTILYHLDETEIEQQKFKELITGLQ